MAENTTAEATAQPFTKAFRLLNEAFNATPRAVSIVKIGQPEAISFGGPLSCQAANGLGENIVAVIVSDKGVIMTKLRYGDLEEDMAVMTTMKRKYDELKTTYFNFEHKPYGVIIAGQNGEGNAQLISQINKICKDWGVDPVWNTKYTKSPWNNSVVFVDGRGGVPTVYVEDEYVVDPYERPQN